MEPGIPTVMQFQMQSSNQDLGAPRITITASDTPTIPPRTTGYLSRKKTGAKEKDVVSTVGRKDIFPMTAMRKKKPRNATENGTSEEMEDQVEQKDIETSGDHTTPKMMPTSATPA